MSRGFSLLEVLVAITIMVTGVASLAQLFVLSAKNNTGARATTMATLLAAQKMEQLRALTWSFDRFGTPLGDTTTDTATVPESAAGGTGLSPSRAGTLSANAVGYVDYLDANGNSLGGQWTTAPGQAAFVRRWSIDSLPDDPNDTLVLQVLVAALTHRGVGVADAHLVTLKTRKAM
jgi:prepilin-type N-terminal cleavage/methylation domain-containing protein